MNRHDIAGFEKHADMMKEQMATFLPQGEYNPVANVAMLHGPATELEGMDSEPTSPALQPSVPLAQEMEQDPNFLPLPHFQLQKAKSQVLPAAVRKRKK